MTKKLMEQPSVVKTLFCYLCTMVLFLSSGLYVDTVMADASESTSAGKVMACYYTQTSYFPATQVPADLCTHIIYAFAAVTPEGIGLQPQDLKVYKTLVQLKQKNPQLKILLSLQEGFDTVVRAGTAAMKNFSVSAVKFLSSHDFDGVDLDWEFPSASDKVNFGQFIQILQSELHGANMLLSAAIPNNPYRFQGFDADILSRYMDFMTVMAYDFHLFIKDGDNKTGYNSPLYTPAGESKYFSTSALMTYYLSQGIPSNKLLMGIPLYGRSWTLANSSQHDLHSPAVGKGGPSPYRGLKGIYLNPDVCLAIQRGAKYVLDDKNGAAYLYANSTWVAYDGRFTIGQKLKWMKSQNLGGVGIWAIHLDDNANVCKDGNLPLLNVIKSGL